MDGWKNTFLFGSSIFRGYVSFSSIWVPCSHSQKLSWLDPLGRWMGCTNNLSLTSFDTKQVTQFLDLYTPLLWDHLKGHLTISKKVTLNHPGSRVFLQIFPWSKPPLLVKVEGMFQLQVGVCVCVFFFRIRGLPLISRKVSHKSKPPLYKGMSWMSKQLFHYRRQGWLLIHEI